MIWLTVVQDTGKMGAWYSRQLVTEEMWMTGYPGTKTAMVARLVHQCIMMSGITGGTWHGRTSRMED